MVIVDSYLISPILQGFVPQLLPLAFPPQAMATEYEYLNHWTRKQSDHICISCIPSTIFGSESEGISGALVHHQDIQLSVADRRLFSEGQVDKHFSFIQQSGHSPFKQKYSNIDDGGKLDSLVSSDFVNTNTPQIELFHQHSVREESVTYTG
ncbi:hypothetical protein BC826DRAFT_576892 [Russula brevipes]|nr:hypothetical protein BC826DRAFT_576892 [Russula brevipes]